MEYTVQKLGQLAGVSSRTLRYYDELGILKPARINSSGYRIYSAKEIDKLQQILFYRELGISLEKIKEILDSPTFNETIALKEHRKKLIEKRSQLDMLLANVEKTIAAKEKGIYMNDKEKFEGFKQKLIDENEIKYGKEIRRDYGHQAVNKSNEKLKNITPEEYERVNVLANDVMETLHKAYLTGDPTSDLAQQAVDLHRQWLTFYWDSYTKEAHAGIAQMYVEDERFKAYYDKEQPGTAEFLRAAILVYIEKNK